MSSTALGSRAEKAQELIFISEAHEKFYYEKLKESKRQILRLPLNLTPLL